MAEDDDRPDAVEDEDVLGRLRAELEQATSLYRTDELRGCIEMLKTTADILDKVVGIPPTPPLAGLMAGLVDLSRGFPPKWLSVEAHKSPHGGQHLDLEELAFRARIKGTADFLYTILGNRTKATAVVAGVLGLTPDTVRGWTGRLPPKREGFDARGIAAAYAKTLARNALGMPPEEAVDCACEVLGAAARRRKKLTLPPSN